MKKKVLILGASSDIGQEIIKLFLLNNYEIIAHYYRGNKNFFSLIEKNKIKKIKFNFLTKPNLIDKFAKNNLFKNCDILINALGRIKENDYENISSKSILDSIKVNLIPSIIFTKNLGLNMSKRKWGRIVNLGSIGVKFGGGIKNFEYSLAKFGLEFFPSATKKWIKKNVLINTIRVGVTNTKIHKNIKSKNLKRRVSLIPMNRMATTYEIAKLVYYLASENNSYISNDIISISGGE